MTILTAELRCTVLTAQGRLVFIAPDLSTDVRAAIEANKARAALAAIEAERTLAALCIPRSLLRGVAKGGAA